MISTAPAACSVYTTKTPALSSPGDERWSAFCLGTLRARNTPLSTRNHNRFVELYLTGKKKLPRAMPDSYSFGSEEEALICLETIGEAWAMHPEALIWLLMQVEGVRERDQTTQRKLRGNLEVRGESLDSLVKFLA